MSQEKILPFCWLCVLEKQGALLGPEQLPLPCPASLPLWAPLLRKSTRLAAQPPTPMPSVTFWTSLCSLILQSLHFIFCTVRLCLRVPIGAVTSFTYRVISSLEVSPDPEASSVLLAPALARAEHGRWHALSCRIIW